MKRIALVLLLTITVVGCGKKEISREKREPTMLVSVAEVTRRPMSETLSYVGDVKAQEEIVVYSKASGKLIENTVSEGDTIKKDDVLALIDRDETGFKFEKASVTSPIDGIVGRVYLDRGMYVRPSNNMSSGTPVAFIVDMNTVKVKINVTERELPGIKVGQDAQIIVDTYPDKSFAGRVDKISPVVDLASRTALTEIKIPNQGNQLRSGMFARVKLILSRRENVLVVPIKTIIHKDGKKTVFVVEENIAGLREVKTGLKNGELVEITSGLNEGEIIVVDGGYGLKNGARVIIK